MKYTKVILTSLTVLLSGISLSGCENAHVSGSVSYGMSMGAYPMYYGGGYYHAPMVVVRPPRGGHGGGHGGGRPPRGGHGGGRR